MSPKDFLIQALADAVADDLMTAGEDNKANRLHLLDASGQYLGGWSKRGLANRIALHLRGELSRDAWVQFWNETMEDDEVEP